MHHNGVQPNLAHQHDIAGKFGHCIGIAHGVAAKFHHHNGARVALQIGQGLGKGAGGCNPVAVHILLSHVAASLANGLVLACVDAAAKWAL